VNHIADIELVDSHPEGIRSNNYLHARRRGWQRGKDEKREEQTEKNEKREEQTEKDEKREEQTEKDEKREEQTEKDEKREEQTVTTIYIKAISPSLSRP
jgi:hypothetical protein